MALKLFILVMCLASLSLAQTPVPRADTTDMTLLKDGSEKSHLKSKTGKKSKAVKPTATSDARGRRPW